MFKRWPAGFGLSLISVAARADESVAGLPPLTALVLLTLIASLTLHLWFYPDALRSSFRKPILLLGLGSLATTLLWSSFAPGHQGIALLGFAAILTGTLFTLNHWVRQAGFASVKKLLLQELAQQTASQRNVPAAPESLHQTPHSADQALHSSMPGSMPSSMPIQSPMPSPAFTDALTRTFQRQYFDRQLVYEWHSAQREQHPLSLMLIEIDHWQGLNDQHGRDAGEKALCAVVEVLQYSFQRGSDTLCRYDEQTFAVLLPNTLPADALALAEQVRQSLARSPLDKRARRFRVTASSGVGGMIPQPGDDPEVLLSAVGQALQRARQDGCNGCRLATRYPTGSRSSQPRSQPSSTGR